MAVVGRTGDSLGRASWRENDQCGGNQTEPQPIPRGYPMGVPPTLRARRPRASRQDAGASKINAPTSAVSSDAKSATYGKAHANLEPRIPTRCSSADRRCCSRAQWPWRRPQRAIVPRTRADGARMVPRAGCGSGRGCWPLHLLRDPAQITDTASRHSQTCRIAAYCRSALDLIAPLTPTGAPRLTIKVCPGVVGILGTLKCCGGFTMRGTVFHPVQMSSPAARTIHRS